MTRGAGRPAGLIGFTGWGCCRRCRTLTLSLAFDFDTVAWEDYDGVRHAGKPSDLSDTYGLQVHAYDPETGESHHFWAFVGGPFEDWTEWLDYIGSLMEMHGMSLA